ncbi:MAG: hypothetical protein UHN88_01040 [Eubacterium sp.]|nr:hypothetical protein [Eubacterium sp.]
MDFSAYPQLANRMKQIRAKLGDKEPLLNKKEWRSAQQSWQAFTPEQLQTIEYESGFMPPLGIDGFKYAFNSYLTSEALIAASPFFRAIPLRDILWIYQETTKNSVNLVPTSKEIGLMVVTRTGDRYKLFSTTLAPWSKKNPCEAALEFLQQNLLPRRPGIILGYNDKVAQLAQTNPAALAQCVDEHSVQQ